MRFPTADSSGTILNLPVEVLEGALSPEADIVACVLVRLQEEGQDSLSNDDLGVISAFVDSIQEQKYSVIKVIEVNNAYTLCSFVPEHLSSWLRGELKKRKFVPTRSTSKPDYITVEIAGTHITVKQKL